MAAKPHVARPALVIALLGLLAVGSIAAPAQQQVQPGSAPAAAEFVYVVTDDTATGLYHHKDCTWLRNHTMRGYAVDEAKKRYFQPHCLCTTGKEGNPPCDAAPAPVPAAATTSPSTTTAPATTTAAPPAARPAVPAAVPAARSQCAATTQRGARCLRLADAGSAYCWQHKR